MKRFYYLLIGFILFSCEPTKITRVWTDKEVMPAKYKKILVLGLLTEKEVELSDKIENYVADNLREMGYLTLASNKIFTPGTLNRNDTAAAMNTLLKNGFDAVLTIVLLDKKKEPYYVPGKITDNPRSGDYRRFDKYFNAVAERIYAKGYYGEETKYIWENNFYDLYNKKMIYSARSRSFDFASMEVLAKNYGFLMAKSLVEKKILKDPGTEEE